MKAGLPQLEPQAARALGQARPLSPPARGGQGPAQVHPARRPALRQRQHPHRHRAQQDPEGHGDALPADAGLRFQLRAGLGLPRPAHRVEDRGAVPRQGPGQGHGARQRVPPASAASSPSTGSACRREEFKRLGVEGDWEHYYSTMAYKAEATIAAELMKFAMNGALYPRLQAGDVERGGEDGAGGGRGRVPRLHERHGVGEVSRRRGAHAHVGEQHETARRTEALTERVGRHLDHDAMDDPGQPRDQLFHQDRLRALSGDGGARGQLGTKRRPATSWPTNWPSSVMKAAKVESLRASLEP